ncbi:MAG: DNA polymerase [Methanothrix sp.]|nr:DNA polymerase [Methanothrix sp.]
MTLEGYPGCEKCPLAGQPMVFGKGPSGGIAIVGEAPGTVEVAKKEPFVGLSGKLLRETLNSAGVDPGAIYITNAVLCHPDKNEAPSKTAIQCCRARLLSELKSQKVQKVLSVGAIPLSALAPEVGTAITKTHGIGTMINLDSETQVYYVPTYHPAAIIRDPDLFRDLARDVIKLLTHDSPVDLPDCLTIVCRDVPDTLYWLDVISKASRLSCDLETTGLSAQSDRILSLGFGALTIGEEGDTEGLSVIVPRNLVYIDEVREAVRRLLHIPEIKWVYHNSKFDVIFLQQYLQERYRPAIMTDTMLLQYAQDERGSDTESTSNDRGSYRVHGLKDQARMRFDIPDYHFDFKIFYATPEEERDWESLYTYHGKDCFFTLLLCDELEKELDDESPKLRQLTEGFLVPGALALGEIEFAGTKIDIEYLKKLRTQTEEELLFVETQLRTVAQKYGIEKFNPASPLQVKELFTAIKFFAPSSEREVMLMTLKKTKATAEVESVVKYILEFRQKSKVLSTYIEGLLKRADSNGRVHPDFWVHGTATGRLSCHDPNLQNIPTLMGQLIRDAFIADEGRLLLEADFSQLELRIAAWYSGDQEMISAYQNNEDLHKKVAAAMFKKPVEEVTHLERYMAKYVDFGIIYGRGAKSLSEGWEMEYVVEQGGKPWTLHEAEVFLKKFLDSFPGLRDWISYQQKQVVKDKYIETPMGRRRRFPLLTNQNIGNVQRQAVNAPVQSLASDLCFGALWRLHDLLPEGYNIRFTVHDSIMFEIPENYDPEVLEMIAFEMTQNIPIDSVVPFQVDMKIGKRWGQMEKLKHE